MTNERRVILLAAAFALLMGLEVAASAADRAAASWGVSIQRMDRALGARDVIDAEHAVHDSNVAVQGSRSWEGMVALGDAYQRMGDATGFQASARAKARQAYLAAFFRARTQNSLEGVLRATEGFAALGDREVAAQCLKTVEQLAARNGDPDSRERLSALTELVAGRVAGLELSASY
jgi:hypothetical protein